MAKLVGNAREGKYCNVEPRQWLDLCLLLHWGLVTEGNLWSIMRLHTKILIRCDTDDCRT